MLDDIKECYANVADASYPGWQKIDRNDLCRQYIDLQSEDQKGGCLAAIICKFWPIASKNYYGQLVKIASEEDCYTWLINGIMYVLDHHIWTDPNNQLYQDPKAPEKAINVNVQSEKINFFVSCKRAKRKINYNHYSLESLQEDSSDDYYLPTNDNYDYITDKLKEKILTFYNQKDYFSAFVVDCIARVDFTIKDQDYSQFSKNKLKRYLRSLDDSYAAYFAREYNLVEQEVKDNLKYVTDISSDRVENNITRLFGCLKQDKDFIELLKG